MISNPIAKVSKFSGMSDQGGLFYLDGFSVENENGVESLDENFLPSEVVNNGTTNYSNLGSIMAMSFVYPLAGSNISDGGYPYRLMLNDSGALYSRNIFNTLEMYNGKVGGVSSGGSSYLYIQKPDIFVLPSGNIIYTSSRHLSLGIRGLVKTGSSTTTIVDKDGRNFTTLGVKTGDTVTNLITGSIYTITAIGNGDATNDKLTFTAIGATTNSENDEFLLISLERWDLNYSDGTSGGSALTIPVFNGQPAQTYWVRPIRQWGNQYMILNGNYIALLASDESTIDCSYKQLPTGYQAIAFDINSGYILISAYDADGNGHLLYWDGFSDGWNEDLKVPKAPSSLKSYNTGWICLVDGMIQYTNGISIETLISIPDIRYTKNLINSPSHNCICILRDKIYFAVSGETPRIKNGVLIYDNKTGLTQFKCKANGKGFTTANCIYVNPFTPISSQYQSDNDIEIGCGLSLNNLNDFTSGSTTDFKSFMILLDFEQETQVSQVWLNIKRPTKTIYTTRANVNSTVSVNIGNDNAPIIKNGQTGTNNTTSATNSNGAIYPGVIGEEIEFLDGNCAGQRTFITGITDGGTSSEVWTLSPALSTAYNSSSNLRVWSVKNGETKAITSSNFNKPVIFNVNFFGSKMYLEVVVRGATNSLPISITDILLF